jgi:hypothetical protein
VSDKAQIESFIAEWAPTGGSELANTQSFVNGLCALIGVDPPKGSRTDDTHNDYVFERRVFQKEADGQGAQLMGQLQAGLDTSWLGGSTAGARFDAFRALPEDTRANWFAFAIATSLEPSLNVATASRAIAFHHHVGAV